MKATGLSNIRGGNSLRNVRRVRKEGTQKLVLRTEFRISNTIVSDDKSNVLTTEEIFPSFDSFDFPAKSAALDEL